MAPSTGLAGQQPSGPPAGPPSGLPDAPGPAGTGQPREVTIAAMMLLMLPLLGVAGIVVALAAMSVAQGNAADVVAELEAEFGAGFPGEFEEFDESGGPELPGPGELFDAEAMVDSMLSAMWLQFALISLVQLIQVVGFGVLALAVLRGSQAGRIITFVLAGVLSLGAVILGALGGVRQSLRSRVDHVGEELGFSFVYEDALLPGWYEPLNWTVIAVSISVIIVVVWLLTRPAANEYFRPRGGHAATPPSTAPAAGPHSPLTVQVPGPPPAPPQGLVTSEATQPLALHLPDAPPKRQGKGRWYAIGVLVLLVGVVVPAIVLTRTNGDDTTNPFASLEGLCSKIDPTPGNSLNVPLGLTDDESDPTSAKCTFESRTEDATATLGINVTLVDDPDHRQAIFNVSANPGNPVPELTDRWDDSAIYSMSQPDPYATDSHLSLTVMDGPLVIWIFSIVERDWPYGQDSPTEAALIEIVESVRDLQRQ